MHSCPRSHIFICHFKAYCSPPGTRYLPHLSSPVSHTASNPSLGFWMLSISTHTGCLNHWHKLLFSLEDLDLSADSAAGSVVVDGLKYYLLPSCHCAAAAGICDTAFVRGHRSSSCLLSLILMAAEPRSTTQN